MNREQAKTFEDLSIGKGGVVFLLGASVPWLVPSWGALWHVSQGWPFGAGLEAQGRPAALFFSFSLFLFSSFSLFLLFSFCCVCWLVVFGGPYLPPVV